MTPLRPCLLVLLLMSLASGAQAQVTALCDARFPCTSNPSATAGVDSRVNLTWRGQARTSPRLSQSLVSNQGTFLLGDPVGGQRLGTSPTPLVQPIGPSTDDRGVEFRMTESLRVPAAISQQAARQGERQLFYVRQFGLEGSEPMTGVQVITLQQGVPGRGGAIPEGTEPSATGVTIQRVSLFFDRGSLTETLRPDETLQATARISYQGAGIVNAIWEVATPASTRGQPLYAPLSYVRQYLGAGRELTLTSPPLPSDTSGIHRVRLRFLPPTEIEGLPTLSYRISEGALQRDSRVPTIAIFPPESASPLSRETRFRWRPVAGSHAYQLEFYDRWPGAIGVEASSPGNSRHAQRQPATLDLAPITGQVVVGERTSTSPSSSLLSHLEADKRYYWRLIAIDAQGGIIAASPLEAILHAP
ncbi:hypothetical protein HOP52_15135 [Halomonas campisalis]|uniref:Uncharacterized protein n=1 Tax=Billgrantia campisalis TaxID=74661 RepID=A0ABS9PCX5_9GAMM|nr:hypothetical protein [Halomonas campisalis]MCG6659092.1 hypothetical protein [Halomonas campisalis]MDR5863874.1 hypothetical protein [Halomonas campisalis]